MVKKEEIDCMEVMEKFLDDYYKNILYLYALEIDRQIMGIEIASPQCKEVTYG